MFSISTTTFFLEKVGCSILTILFLLISFSSKAQTEEVPWQFFVGVNAVDTFPTGAAGSGELFEEFINIDHWNVTPFPSYLGVKKFIGAGFSFGTRFSFNTIQRYGDNTLSEPDNYYNVDGIISYNLNALFGGKSLMPFVELGGGYAIFGEQGTGYFNLGAGIELWLGEKKKTALTLETLYKNTGETFGVKHFQHLLGVVFLFGGEKDSDGDGIPDQKDNCSETPGIPEFNGCPDTDGDGIQDAEDDCPEVPGISELNGCPDRDGDGVKDQDYKCPDEYGSIENEGCPEISENTIERLQEIGQTVFFETAKWNIDARNNLILDEVYKILTKYPTYKIEIGGHTDAVGSVSSNQILSQRRAASVMEYLINKGLEASRMSSKGYGETQPIRNSNTKEGQSVNRRVEFKLY